MRSWPSITSGKRIRPSWFTGIHDAISDVDATDANIKYGIENVLDYDGTPDGVTDATAAWQQAAAAAKANGTQLYGRGEYFISDTVEIASDADLSAVTFYTSDNTITAVRIGTTESGIKINSIQVVAPRVIQDKVLGTGWVGSDVGIEIANLNNSFVRVPWIENFKTGLRVTAYDTGSSYNNIEIGFLRNNQYQQAWQPEGLGSWVNENTILGGRHEYRSAEGTNITDARYILIDDSGDVVNGLVFIRPSLEGDGPGTHVEVRNGQQNLFLKPRCEVSAFPWKLLFAGASCQRNELFSATSLNDIEVTEADSARRNSVYLPNGWLLNGGDLTRPSMRLQNSSEDGMILGLMAHDADLSDDATTGYLFGFFEDYLAFKAEADTAPRLQIDHATGLISAGPGSGAADVTWGRLDVGIFGSASHRISAGNGFRVGNNSTSPTIRSGASTPEGGVSAPVGSIFLRTGGGAGTTLYIKESGTGNTGWVPVV